MSVPCTSVNVVRFVLMECERSYNLHKFSFRSSEIHSVLACVPNRRFNAKHISPKAPLCEMRLIVVKEPQPDKLQVSSYRVRPKPREKQPHTEAVDLSGRSQLLYCKRPVWCRLQFAQSVYFVWLLAAIVWEVWWTWELCVHTYV